ncbi:MAG TPA: hypothetical protein VHY22_14805 [Chthoniobacteraceae bacterium]|jgi:hypothetical protein|nr:hypothetical protein [Chthoniobacteraceae bacterium]
MTALPYKGVLRVLGVLILCALWSRGDVPAGKLEPALGWDVNKQGGFAVSIAADQAGNIWVGTEGNGVWEYNPVKKSWTQFTTKDGLGDDCAYAVAVDRLNRVWVGHLNHGVSVYNGDKWRNYALMDGPIGDRVFAITVSPRDGDVWIGTDMGVARYSEKRQDWDYYTRASGLPSDQIQAIAFGSDGKVYLGTQSDGIAVAGPGENYTRWTTVTAPEGTATPLPAVGEGLVSNCINAMMAVPAADGKSIITALTPSGVSAMPDDAGQWLYVRAEAGKGAAAVLPVAGLMRQPGQFNLTLPPEDWMTAIGAEGDNVWIGYRKAGVEMRAFSSPAQPKVRANVEKGSVIIRGILALPDEPPFFAAYDADSGGLLTLDSAPAFKPGANVPAARGPAPFPAGAPIPTVADAALLSARLGKLSGEIAPGEAFYLADDWRTEGDWIGRYGSGFTKLCGIAQNGDQDYSLEPGYEVSLAVGPHHEASAAGPVWYHSNESSDDLRSPYDPLLGHRRDAEDNDVSYDTKTYPESYDGPDLWVKATVPVGVHCLSLYFLNNDAHSKNANKYRDYDIQVFSDLHDNGKVQTDIPLAHTRVTDFWGGVYKQFLICGPAHYVVRIGRDKSFVTKLQGVFLDPVTVPPPDNSLLLPGFDTVQYQAPDEPDNLQATPLTEAAVNLWKELDDDLGLRGAVDLQMPFRIWCYRAAFAGQAPPELLERWRWQISIWTPDDRKKFDTTVKAAHDAATK